MDWTKELPFSRSGTLDYMVSVQEGHRLLPGISASGIGRMTGQRGTQ